MIYDQSGQVLVLQRKDDPEFWQSVTGSLEANELPIETAVRELEEETGICVKAYNYEIVDRVLTNRYTIRPDWQYRYGPNVTSNLEYVFSVEIHRDTPLELTEHLQFEWLSKEEAIDRVWSESNKQAIEKFVPEAACK